MQIQLLTPIVTTIHKGVVQGLPKAKDRKAFITSYLKKGIVGILSGSSESISTGIWVPASLVAGAIKAIRELRIRPTTLIRSIVSGAIQGSIAVGVPKEVAIQGSVMQVIYQSRKPVTLSANAILGAISALEAVQMNESENTRVAIIAAYEAALSINADVAETIKDELTKKIDGAGDIFSSYRSK